MNRTDAFKVRLWIAGICLLLPSLTLIPLGGLWLFQNGFTLYWVAGAAVFVVFAFLLQLYLFRPAEVVPPAVAHAFPGDEAAASWTPREQDAWTGVVAIANSVKFDDVLGVDSALSLGKRTIDVVARSLHPEVNDPVWKFTAPEALALIEQVSQRLRPVIVSSIPLGDQLTVGQIIRVYRWRSAIDVVQKGYDVWRVIRMLNPATAATQELRERLSKRMVDWGKDEIGKRLARGYVQEVGRAAIDLYGGRLRVTEAEIEQHVTTATERDRKAAPAVAEPVRILIAGQVNAGKSSLVNGLLAEIKAAADVLPATKGFSAYEIKRDGVAQILLLDSAGLSNGNDFKSLTDEAVQADLILWVSSAVRPDRALDAQALDAIRATMTKRTEIRRAPMGLVISHVDRLRPFQEWSPPYNLLDTNNAKVDSIRAAMEAARVDLGFAEDVTIPVCLDRDVGLYNVDALWALIVDKMPDAKRTQLVRTLRDIDGRFDWRQLRTQTVNAGRVLVDVLLSKRKPGPTP